jgi:hypothetical protein
MKGEKLWCVVGRVGSLLLPRQSNRNPGVTMDKINIVITHVFAEFTVFPSPYLFSRLPAGTLISLSSQLTSVKTASRIGIGESFTTGFCLGTVKLDPQVNESIPENFIHGPSDLQAKA